MPHLKNKKNSFLENEKKACPQLQTSLFLCVLLLKAMKQRVNRV